MSKLSKCEKHDCRWKQRRCMLQANEMCNSCKHFDKYSQHYWFQKKIVTTGKCSLLLQPPPSHPTSPIASPPLKRSNRNRTAVGYFTNNDRLKKSITFQSQKNYRRRKQRTRKREVLGELTNKINKAASTKHGRSAIAKSISTLNEPNLSTGGYSKSSMYKSKQTARALIAGLEGILQFPLKEYFQQKQAAMPSPFESSSQTNIRSTTTTDASCLHPSQSHSTTIDQSPLNNLTSPTTVTICQPITPSEQQESIENLKRRKMIADVKQEVGSFLIKRLQTMTNTSLRRPILACLRTIERDEDREKRLSKVHVEDALNCRISHREWHNIGIHARYPGPFVPVHRKKSFKNRVDSQVLLKLLHFLDSPGNLQKYAFGTQVLQILDGSQSVTAACVNRNQKIETLAIKFIRALSDEMVGIASEVLPPSEDRCQQLEERTLRRCVKHRGHCGKCAYRHKAVSPISLTTAKKLISALTAGEVKKLTGLDDVKVFKGRDNFQKQRKLVEKFFEIGSEKDQILKDIDEVEMFYVTDFIPHLHRESEFKCN